MIVEYLYWFDQEGTLQMELFEHASKGVQRSREILETGLTEMIYNYSIDENPFDDREAHWFLGVKSKGSISYVDWISSYVEDIPAVVKALHLIQE